MKILLIGHSGTIGSAIHQLLTQRGHEVVTAARDGGDITVDISDHDSVRQMFESTGTVDAVVAAAGHTPFVPFAELKPDDFTTGWHGKALCQIDLVLTGAQYIAEGGSFTLTTGILAHTPIARGAVTSTVNGAIESFVEAAAAEAGSGIRVNAVSPTAVTESAAKNAPFFPGFTTVPVDEVALAYVRSIEGIESGKVFRVGH